MSEEAVVAEKKVKKVKKVAKVVDGFVLNVTTGEGLIMSYDASTLSQAIKDNLLMHGLSQKIGDCFAGKTGSEGKEAADKTWDALVKGEWSIRVPAAEKITKKDVIAAFEGLTDEEKEIAKKLGLLAKLGIKA